LAGFAANLDDVVVRGIRTKQRVIDQAGDGRIDAGQSVASREPARAGLHNLFRFSLAGLRTALRASGTHQVRNIQALGVRSQTGETAGASEDFLSDLRD